jgi:hypothetical protein
LRNQGYDVFRIAKDDATGSVDLTASTASAKSLAAAMSARYGPDVKVTASDDRPQLAYSHKIASTYELGGLMMSGPTEGCTAGFGGITSDGHYWILSAGHCFTAGQTIKQQVGSSGVGIIGPMHKSLFVHGGTSYCDCETIGPVSASQSVGRPTNKIYYPPNANPAIHGSRPQGSDYQGELVAMSDGNGDHSNFGQIIQTDENNYYTNTNAWVYHQEDASVQAYPTILGDSGSPVFQNNGSNSIAEGMISGINSDGSHTYFSTMWQVQLYLNVSVLTYQP